MTRSSRYPTEVRERAMRLVIDHRDQYRSEWAAITSITAKCGMTAETLQTWIRRDEVDSGSRQGVTTDERERLRGFCQNSVLKLKFVPNFAMHIGAFVLGTLMLDVIPTAKNRVEH